MPHTHLVFLKCKLIDKIDWMEIFKIALNSDPRPHETIAADK